MNCTRSNNCLHVQAKEEVPLHLDEDELDWSEENPFEAERRKKKEALQAEAKALSKELKVSCVSLKVKSTRIPSLT